MNLAGFAAAVRAAAARAEAGLAEDCARTAAREYLAALAVTTPVESGRLRESEHVYGVTGSGAVAVAVVGSDLVYARFRNFGGTIKSKGPWPLRSADGRVFGRQVTQAGSHYMERAEGEAAGPIAASCRIKLDEYLKL